MSETPAFVRIDPESKFALFQSAEQFENSVLLAEVLAQPNSALLEIYNANVDEGTAKLKSFKSRSDAVSLTTKVILTAATPYVKNEKKVKPPKPPKEPKAPKAPRDPNAPKAQRGSGKIPADAGISLNPQGRIAGALAAFAKEQVGDKLLTLADASALFQTYKQPRGTTLSAQATWGRSIVSHLVGRGVLLAVSPSAPPAAEVPPAEGSAAPADQASSPEVPPAE